MPTTTNAGDIISYAINYVSVPHVHGGQQYVINFHDLYSTLNTPYLLARKTDAFIALQHYIAYCKSHHVTVRRVHTDNAGDLTSSRSATSCCSRELGSRQFLHMYHDRKVRANGSGAR
eukprot:1450156-Pleurochrysis_carterae.AAC.1